jgi:ATP-dependent Lhr-like helicase
VPEGAAERIAGFLTRQVQAAPIPVDEPVQVEQIVSGRTLLVLFHVVAGRNVNRALAWVLASRVSDGASVVANFDDHAFLLSLDARRAPSAARLREGFNPERWPEDLQTALQGSEMLGRRFRAVAETGQLLPRKSFLPGHGSGPVRVSSWSASLLYTTLREHEPEHPLVRETVREVLEDECDSQRAAAEAARIFAAPWEVFNLARPSPFALPLFTAFNRETLLAQDPDRAIEELAAELYDEWAE